MGFRSHPRFFSNMKRKKKEAMKGEGKRREAERKKKGDRAIAEVPSCRDSLLEIAKDGNCSDQQSMTIDSQDLLRWMLALF